MTRVRRWVIAVLVAAGLFGGTVERARATAREARVPLRDGKIHLADLSAAACRKLHLPEWNVARFGADATIDVNGLRGSLFVTALNASVGEGCRVTVTDDALVLHFDAERLPDDWDETRKAARVFTAVAAPEATARQRATYGLHLPADYDPARPLVVFLHGLDCDRANWVPMAGLLKDEGYQSAYFGFPSDQPIAESAESFANHMALLHGEWPAARVHVIAHSMGGLVARAYIEGNDYAGGVDRLILIATPNHGSTWAKYRLALEADEHWGLWRHEPGWSWTWLITDGLGEAGRDLKPGSSFLEELNARPRRAGVKYTLIAGSQHPARRISAKWVDRTTRLIPQRVSGWWGLRQTKNGLTRAADRLRTREGESDGPVTIESVRLEGVDDVVIVHAEHAALYLPFGGEPPAAWETIRDRLTR